MLESNNVTSFFISTGTMIRAVLVALTVFLLWFLRDLVLVVLTAIVLASFVESSVPYFQKLKIKRVFSVIILYAISLLVLSALFYLFAPLLITEIYNFSIFMETYAPNFSLLNYFQNEAFSGAKDIVGSLSDGLSFSTLFSTSNAFIRNLSGGFFSTLSGAFGGIFNFILIILISFYLSIQEKGIENFLRLVTPMKYDNYIVDLWSRSRRKIALWLKGQVVVAIVVAVLVYLVLSLLGIEYALLLAIIAGIAELVPYGIFVALIPAFSLSFISGGIENALMATGAYIIINQFEVFLFTPLIIEKVVGLSPIVIILSILIGFKLAGAWGFILAIPLAIVIMEYLNDIEKNKILARVGNK
ncbi:hypothetical protein A2814_02395 [Candidatus Nomurabacteria bacterium RIFCSPHIGHO2_01_FULL_38_19]|uniref:AI-2E family transporter n=1 Tax=Candidatus Nomurabacteria bacterium RIFCSPHIGHO2_01_FULL_38_19 TaxID=1801732 RepID=A0A1F6UR67_9BACT|nr:MAG: hypothetical protein A2814_02395 [Candidatus Nomurabacteria bacterium RIFCSPHIGHO2_01_FULL_38_19]